MEKTIFYIFILHLIARPSYGIDTDIGSLCSEQIGEYQPSCSDTISIDCSVAEHELKLDNTRFDGGVYPSDKFLISLVLKCSVPDDKTFHELSVQDIQFTNDECYVRIKNSDTVIYEYVSNTAPFEEVVLFTQNSDFSVDVTISATLTQTPVIKIKILPVPHKSVEMDANETGIEASNLYRNTEHIWRIPAMNGQYIIATFPFINISSEAGDVMVISDGEPFQAQTYVLPYKTDGLKVQLRRDGAKVRLETGRHFLPVAVGFKAVFEREEPITTTTRAPSTTTPRPPADVEFATIVVIGWAVSQWNDTEVINDVKHELGQILNCKYPSESGDYQVFLVNQTACSHSWTTSFYNCTQVNTVTANKTLSEYKTALGDKKCREKHSKYGIRFPEEMFDFYNTIAIPIAAASLAIIIVVILAIWRGSLALSYRRQLKKREKGYNSTASMDSGKGQYNQAFEPVEDDEDVVFDPTIDGSIYGSSRYSSISTGTGGGSTFKTDDEPTSVTFTSGKYPNPKKSPGTTGETTFTYTNVPTGVTFPPPTPRSSIGSVVTSKSTTDL